MVRSAASVAPVEQKLISFVQHDQEAAAIVKKVNDDYPGGFLAQLFPKVR
jgi:hypothetical protein